MAAVTRSLPSPGQTASSGGAAAKESPCSGPRDPRASGTESLPLRDPYADPQGGPARRADDADRRLAAPRRRIWPMNSLAPMELSRRHLLGGAGALIVSFS